MKPHRTYSTSAVENRRALGAAGEQRAALWYRDAGYTVVDRNWRCQRGEIDLIVANSSHLVFCEVKTRTSRNYGVPAAAVTPTKQRRIRQLAMLWLGEHDAHRDTLRFDVVSIVGDEINVIEGAF